MESEEEEILREILVRLPTRDLLRSSCVSRLWRAVIGEPSFRRLHASAAHIVSGPPETLLVTEIRGMRTCLEAVVLNVSSGKRMCRITDLAGGYSPTNACNGFLCLAAYNPDWPLYVCNPVTGDKLKVPPPPEIKNAYYLTYAYAMGFFSSASLQHKYYKLFRLFFSFCLDIEEGVGYYLDVYTLGGWRRTPYLLPHRVKHDIEVLPPVHIDGKLYMLTKLLFRQAYDKIIVIDVASEVHGMYRLPPEEFTEPVKLAMHAFEMSGRLCIAVHLSSQRLLRFWVMPPLQGMNLLGNWELRYTFNMKVDHDGHDDNARAAWFNDVDRMLCYRLGDRLHKYDTTKDNQQVGGSLEWDLQNQLPAQEEQRWNIYGSYRPSLVSPRLAFAPSVASPQNIDEQESFEQALLYAVGCKKAFNSKRPFPTNDDLPDPTDDQRVPKRIREPTE